MRIEDLAEQAEETLEEAVLNRKKALNLHGVKPEDVNDYEEFADYVSRQKDVNPALYRKLMGMD